MGRRLILLLAGLGGVIVVLAVAFAIVAGSYRSPSESMARSRRASAQASSSSSASWRRAETASGPVPEDWVIGKLWFVYKH